MALEMTRCAITHQDSAALRKREQRLLARGQRGAGAGIFR